MKIKGVNVRIPPAVWVVFGLFVVLFVAIFFGGGCTMPSILYWGLPLALLMVVLAGISNYSLSSQYIKLRSEYEGTAKPTRIRKLTHQMEGKAVRIHGVVQKRVSGVVLGRPRVTVYDGSASCIVFRSIPLDEKLVVGDSIEAVGMVVKKFLIAGALSVHGIIIRKCDDSEDFSLDYDDDEEKTVQPPSVKIKRYN